MSSEMLNLSFSCAYTAGIPFFVIIIIKDLTTLDMKVPLPPQTVSLVRAVSCPACTAKAASSEGICSAAFPSISCQHIP